MAILGFTQYKVSSRDQVYFNVADDLSTVLFLSATEQYSSSSEYQMSNQPTVAASTVTDNIIRQPRQCNISGVFVSGGSFTAAFAHSMTTNDFVDAIELWRQQRQIMTLTLPNGLSLPKCFITKFDCDADKTIVNGLRVQMSFQEIVEIPQQLGKASTTVKETNTGSGASGQATTKKGSVTTQKSLGHAATSVTSSKAVCSHVLDGESSYTGNDNLILDAQRSCKMGQVGSISRAQAEKQAQSDVSQYTLKNHGGNPNKVYGVKK